ncbi:MAG: hypothetical protein AB1445_01020 [Bacillota bacterium]
MLVRGLTLIAVLAVLALTVMRRARNLQRLSYEGEGPLDSPVSRALREFLGVAGGVYLALVALNEFLKLNVPNPVEYRGLSFDPLAALAVLLAIIQPWLPPTAHRARG